MASSDRAAATGREGRGGSCAGSSSVRSSSRDGSSDITELVSQLVRNAAVEVVKSRDSPAETTHRVVSEAVETLEELAPRLAKDAAWEGVKERIPGMGRKRERQR